MNRPSVCFDVFSFQPLPLDEKSIWTVDDPGTNTNAYLVGPAFFDPQVNGFAGVDFQDPNISLEELEKAVAAIRLAGCSHFLVTLITNDPEFLEDQFARIGSFLDQSKHLRESILGFHLEGPFISPEAGFHGAHPQRYTRSPDLNLFHRWQKASGNRIRVLTLAPEWPGSLDFIRTVAGEGVFVCLGHSDASLETLIASVDAGARLFTHLGNGSPAFLPRHENIVQRVLAAPGLMASLIPDGSHVPPPMFGNLVRALGPGRVVFTTDCMSAAGSPPGEYKVGEITVRVGEDGIVRQPGGAGLAGSSLRMVEGFYNVTRFGGLSADGAWAGWTRLRSLIFPHITVPRIRIPFPRG